jgi:hypothetical protein
MGAGITDRWSLLVKNKKTDKGLIPLICSDSFDLQSRPIGFADLLYNYARYKAFLSRAIIALILFILLVRDTNATRTLAALYQHTPGLLQPGKIPAFPFPRRIKARILLNRDFDIPMFETFLHPADSKLYLFFFPIQLC